MYSLQNDPQLAEKEAEYKTYLDEHIHKVHEVYRELGPMLIDRMNSIDISHPIDTRALDLAILRHDLKKYEPDEFDGYRLMYFPTDLETKKYSTGYRQVCFNKAFNLHSHESDHHLEFWSYLEGREIICIPMTNEAIVEMMIDWQTKSGRAFLTPADYWDSIRFQKAVHDETRTKINAIIHLLPGLR